VKKLAIIGASYLQLPIVKKANEMDIETHCFAWEKGAVCKDFSRFYYPFSILDKDHILEVCREKKIDGIISLASDVAVPTISYIAEKMGLIANPYDDVQVATNKFKMRQRFFENGVPSPRYMLDDENIDDKNLHYPLIVKPVDRSGSLGVLKIDKHHDLADAVNRAKKESFTQRAIIEEYVSGMEVSVEAISWEGVHYILAITDKVTTEAPYFVEVAHHQPCQRSNSIQEKIKAETVKALSSLHIRYGASHSEFKINNKGEIFIIEVGARMGGDFIGSHLVQLSTGYDFLKGVIDISLGHFEIPVQDKKNSSGVYFLCEETKHLLPYIKNAGDYHEIVEAAITDDKIRPVQSSADRSGYFIYQGNKRFLI